MDIKYRSDIDGLRAISVILVLLFHGNSSVSGGFIGVDVFFVISGYLITSLVQRGIEEGTFSLRVFWVRRIRRILPASIGCVLGTLILGGLVMLPSDYVNLAKSAAASSAAMANIFFWRESSGGYFAGTAETKPLLHFWSLAVEEQFYLFYPLFLCWGAKIRRISVFHCVSCIFALSLILSVWGVSNRPGATFYLLPFRAWELLLGGLLAVAPAVRIGKIANEMIAISGLLMILGAALTFTRDTPFPGLGAVLPCLGAALVILANSRPRTTSVGRILSSRPLVFVGLISYSLYLWHWPVMALMRYMLIESNWQNTVASIVISFLLATFSWRWIERPFRAGKPSTQEQYDRNCRPIWYGLVCSACVASIAGVIVFGNGLKWRFGSDNQFHVDDATWTGRDMETVPGELKNYPRIGTKESAKDAFVVWGDSHAMMLSEVLDHAAKRKDIAGLFISVPGCPPLPEVWRNFAETPTKPNPEVSKIIQYILDQEIPNVILVARWSAYAEGYSSGDLLFERRGWRSEQFIIGDESTRIYGPEEGRRVLRNQLYKLVTKFQLSGIQVWLVEQVPEQHGPTALPLLLSRRFGISPRYYPASLADHIRRQSTTNSILRSMKRPGVNLVKTQHYFFDDRSSPILIQDGRACFRDNDHLTKHGAYLLENEFIELMNQISLENAN